jgi:hypothetical protein
MEENLLRAVHEKTTRRWTLRVNMITPENYSPDPNFYSVVSI